MPHHRANADAQLEAALDLLRANHQRVTEPRKAILGILSREHGPFTAEELHKRMKRDTCDLVTIYRSLAVMEESGAVRRCDFGDAAYRYEINTGDHHHHHIVCRSCHEAKTLDMCVADGLERMARQLGYTKVTHLLEVFGVCPQCQEDANKQPRPPKD